MMRFCLSLTSHYSILHLTGSASFTDDPFYKCFSKSFFWLEMWSFWIHLSRAENLGTCSYFFVWRQLSALCCAKTSSLSCHFCSEAQAYDYMWRKQKGVEGDLTGGLSRKFPKNGRWSNKCACMHVWKRVSESSRRGLMALVIVD